VLELYNPTGRTIEMPLRTIPNFLPEQEKRVAVEPHESRRVEFA
jgi:hypothetical protein